MISPLRYLTTVPMIHVQAQALICLTALPSRIVDGSELHLSPRSSLLQIRSPKLGLTAEFPATLKLYPKLDGYADTLMRGDRTWELDTNFV